MKILLISFALGMILAVLVMAGPAPAAGARNGSFLSGKEKMAQIGSVPSVPDIFRGILAPAGTFFESLRHISEGGMNIPLQTQFFDFNLGDFLSRFDQRFHEITGISISEFVKAVIGIAIWVFEAAVNLLRWIFQKI